MTAQVHSLSDGDSSASYLNSEMKSEQRYDQKEVDEARDLRQNGLYPLQP